MSYQPSPDEIERIRTLIEKSDLEGIYFHEFSANRFDSPAEESVTPKIDVGVQYRLTEDVFGIRLEAILQNSVGEARVSVSGEYTLSDQYTPTKRDVLLFANEVAVMTIFPYLREGISDLTNRVFGEPVLLPIAPRGVIAFDLDDPAAV